MTKNPMAQNYAQVQSYENPLGAASVAVASIGFGICLCAAVWGLVQQQHRIAKTDRIAHTRYQGGDPSKLFDKVGVGVSYFAQLAIYGVGALVGGTFSLIGFALGVAGTQRQPNRIAVIGIAVSSFGPVLLLICFFLV